MSSTWSWKICLPLMLAALLASASSAATGETIDIDLPTLADSFRRHCVKVYITAKTHAGKNTPVGGYAEDIINERQSPIGGYWWDDNHVIIEDDGLQDRFIRSIEVSMPFSEKRYPARLAGRFVNIQAALLEVLPDEDGEYPAAMPLFFRDGALDKAAIVSYTYANGEWQIRTEGGAGKTAVSDGGDETVEPAASGVWILADGSVVGLAMGKRQPLGPRLSDWFGSEVGSTPVLLTQAETALAGRLRASLAEAVLEVRFTLRVKYDEEDEESGWSIMLNRMEGAAAESSHPGWVVGPHHLLVPLQFDAESIARIEAITVTLPDGRKVEGDYVGALRRYQAVLVGVDEELPAGDAPDGFSMLNPLVMPSIVFQPGSALERRPDLQLFTRWCIEYELGRRRETVDHDRWLGLFRGYRGEPVVMTLTSENAGSLAFDISGRLAAAALSPRLAHALAEDARPRLTRAVFYPIDHLLRELHRDDVFDPVLLPVDEDEGRRLIDLGVEYQGLDANTARLFHASAETRGGAIGMLVTHVYRNSPAETLGLREHDILLALSIEGRSEPLELKAEDGPIASAFDIEDVSTESVQKFMAMMPPPWPSRDNSLTSPMTAAGVGRKARLQFLREGELLETEFTTSYTEPDYRNAKKYRFPWLGLTVKPITYEVERFFHRFDSGGVIVSKVEEGSKGSVAGLHAYLLITHVNGVAVRNADDF
ncbi:MAG: hypothetical protein LIP23_03560, partial [Planctomycetes bacterium]|nr:hypothetical protein [Planctomycetota bacterium]